MQSRQPIKCVTWFEILSDVLAHSSFLILPTIPSSHHCPCPTPLPSSTCRRLASLRANRTSQTKRLTICFFALCRPTRRKSLFSSRSWRNWNGITPMSFTAQTTKVEIYWHSCRRTTLLRWGREIFWRQEALKILGGPVSSCRSYNAYDIKNNGKNFLDNQYKHSKEKESSG